MSAPFLRQGSRLVLLSRSALEQEVNACLVDRAAQGMSAGTVSFYRKKLTTLQTYLHAQGIEQVEDITAPILRRWLLTLAESHSPGGVHALYRAAKTFLLWWERETEPQDWHNPIAKVPAPKVPTEPLSPASIDDVKRMIGACKGKGFLSTRDAALLLFLVDTGVRVGELLALNLGDLDLNSGAALVRKSKNRKPRAVFVSHKTRRALVTYLRHRDGAGDGAPLWIAEEGERLTYSGVRHLLERRAKQVGVPAPSAHSFRRLNALLSLRAGVDLLSIARLLGHSDLSTVSRYVRQISDDLQAAHQKAGIVDKLLG